MGSELDAEDDAACCSCDCRHRRLSPPSWRRSVKRRMEEMEDEGGRGAGLRVDVAARVEVENEAAALREALASHQLTVTELWAELEEERAASATAASETMSMILRLQREKAEVQMEARQFKRFAEEKMAHDQQELVALEDLLYKREQALHALSCEVQAYRHRLLSYGIPPDSVDPAAAGDVEPPEVDDAGAMSETPTYEYQPAFEYPPLRCQDNHHRLDPSLDEEDADDHDMYPTQATTPREREQLQNLEQRIHHLERTQSRSSVVLEMEKGVVMGRTPRPVRTGRSRELSVDPFVSPLAKEHQMCNGKQREELPATARRAPDRGEDDSTSDRVYTVDAVHRGEAAPQAPTARAFEDYVSTPREAVCRVDMRGGGGQEEVDIKKLYMRLESLEADRESMRQALISMRTDKAQLVLLKEIAQHLYRDASSPPPPPGRKIVRKPPPLGSCSFASIIKCILSLVFWRRTQRSKHFVGLSSSNAGLLLLLDKGPRMRQWRCLSRVQG